MSGKEIVTLQIGHYSNFVGAHWWNIQESCFVYDPEVIPDNSSVNHDILFREGVTSKGDVTFTPRLVAIDLKGSLNTLNKYGGLYNDDNEEEIKWSEDVTLHESEIGPKNEYLTDLEEDSQATTSKRKLESSKEDEVEIIDEEPEVKRQVFGEKFYNLDKDVQVWSDYMRTYLHPKTLHIVNDYMHNDVERPFNVFGLGQEVFAKPDVFEEVEDKIRFFAEDCDHLQGFHCLVDTCSGFGGSASLFLQYLEDEFSSKKRLTFGLTPAVLPDSTTIDRANRIINSALCYDKMAEYSSLFVPLSLSTSLWRKLGSSQQFPYLQYQPELLYHTSAILASAIDTMTMPYRRVDNSADLCDITSSFSIIGRKLASLSSSLPFMMPEKNGSLLDKLILLGDVAPWQCLVPHVENSIAPDIQSCVLRGIPPDRVKSKNPSSLPCGFLANCSSTEDVLQKYLTDVYPTTKTAGCIIKDPLPVSTPYPHLFLPNINKYGQLSSHSRLPSKGVESVPIMTSLQSTKGLATLLSSLHSETSRFNIQKHHRFLQTGLDEDGFKGVLDSIQSYASAYED